MSVDVVVGELLLGVCLLSREQNARYLICTSSKVHILGLVHGDTACNENGTRVGGFIG
jgi:hypothetical protein